MSSPQEGLPLYAESTAPEIRDAVRRLQSVPMNIAEEGWRDISAILLGGAARLARVERELGAAAICSPAVVEQLVDAAFHELQHDTGPQDREYVHGRRSLVNAFARILRVRKARTTPAAAAATAEGMQPQSEAQALVDDINARFLAGGQHVKMLNGDRVAGLSLQEWAVLKAAIRRPQETIDSQAATITSLCDRIEKIYQQAARQGVNAQTLLANIRELASGFAKPPPEKLCKHDDGDCHAEDPCHGCPMFSLPVVKP